MLSNLSNPFSSWFKKQIVLKMTPLHRVSNIRSIFYIVINCVFYGADNTFFKFIDHSSYNQLYPPFTGKWIDEWKHTEVGLGDPIRGTSNKSGSMVHCYCHSYIWEDEWWASLWRQMKDKWQPCLSHVNDTEWSIWMEPNYSAITKPVMLSYSTQPEHKTSHPSYACQPYHSCTGYNVSVFTV